MGLGAPGNKANTGAAARLNFQGTLVIEGKGYQEMHTSLERYV